MKAFVSQVPLKLHLFLEVFRYEQIASPEQWVFLEVTDIICISTFYIDFRVLARTASVPGDL